ncbi:ABC transporter permease [Brenneria tiliae]|uniref:ABC transporter permease n=1 Tax=Brenneria tiliae TaxID=2914984 RepID=A0ABT0MWP2_9GAMM|nr:ABC transporter permease [Brenneria tiliae]MCL2894261.1 ABC transporter permease [Brenneria tiliae]
MKNIVIKTVSSLLLFVGLLCLWHFSVVYFGVRSYVLPGPIAVAQALWNGIGNGLYLEHIYVTLTETLTGFAAAFVAALALATLISLSRRASFYLYPYIVFFQSVPKVALAPVIVIWFGLGINSKIVTVALMCFFPLMVNAIAGLQSAQKDRIDLLRSLGANQFQIFMLLRLPSALPFIVAGAEVSMIFALIGAIVAEFVGAQAGLGVLLQTMGSNLDVAGQFAVLVILASIGFLLNRIVTLLGDRLLDWDAGRKSRRFGNRH